MTNKYDLGLNQLSTHNPVCKWLADDSDIKGKMNPYLRKEIEESYLDSWGILNLSIRHKTDLGLRENFTDKKAKQLTGMLSSQDSIIREDRSHNLHLHFISYDKQVVSFTDKDVVLSTHIKSISGSILKMDTSDYKVIMTLNDGKWRVNKFIRIKQK